MSDKIKDRFVCGNKDSKSGIRLLNILKRFRKSRYGAILIEFAFSIPIFLSLIYYIHDLPKQRRIQRKMQFVAHEVTMILQTIGAKHAITQNDLKTAARLAWLTMCPGITQYGTGTGSSPERYMPYGYIPKIMIYCVSGTGENQGTVNWMIDLCPQNPSLGNTRAYKCDLWISQHPNSTVNYTSGAATSIHKNLRISANEKKIIAETFLFYSNKESSRYFSSGESIKDVPIKKPLGLLFISPKAYGQHKVNFFPAVAIFTSVKNAFSDTAPKSQ